MRPIDPRRLAVLLAFPLGAVQPPSPTRPEPPLPGRDRAFAARLTGSEDGVPQGPSWRQYQLPAGAVVEVIGEPTPEELKALRFEEFRVALMKEVHETLGRYGDTPGGPLQAASMAQDPGRIASNPAGRPVPLYRIWRK